MDDPLAVSGAAAFDGSSSGDAEAPPGLAALVWWTLGLATVVQGTLGQEASM